MKRLSILIGIALAGVAIVTWFLIPILPFRAVFHDGSAHHNLSTSTLRPEDRAKIELVLKKYGEHYWTTDTGILITPQLFFDPQLRWNYTSKSGIDPQ